MNIFIDHVGDGHKHYRLAITSILYNECLRRRCLTKKGNVAQVEFYNTDTLWGRKLLRHHSALLLKFSVETITSQYSWFTSYVDFIELFYSCVNFLLDFSVFENSSYVTGGAEVDIFGEPSAESLLKANPHVKPGGSWSPESCKAWQRVAIIIPYRDRMHHLMILLRRLHPMLKLQNIDYRIFVVEQVQWATDKLMSLGDQT